MSSIKKDISVILINYNSSVYTKECINSVLEMTSHKLSYEIIIVDNASENEDYTSLNDYIKNLNKENISLYRSKINLGFGGGNMFGVQFANSNYYAFLNNDTLFLNDCLSLCFEFLQHNLNVAVCGPQIFDECENKIVSFNHFTSLGREIFGNRILEILFPSKKPNRKKAYTEPLKVNYVNGSFMFTRVIDFNNVGGFDTNIFLYFEESDICYRLKQKNKYSFFLPSAKYIHFEGKSTDQNILKKIELKTSMFYVIRKNMGYLSYISLRLFFVIRYTFTSLIKPKYFPLLSRILLGLPISKSLKQKQKIIN